MHALGRGISCLLRALGQVVVWMSSRAGRFTVAGYEDFNDLEDWVRRTVACYCKGADLKMVTELSDGRLGVWCSMR